VPVLFDLPLAAPCLPHDRPSRIGVHGVLSLSGCHFARPPHVILKHLTSKGTALLMMEYRSSRISVFAMMCWTSRCNMAHRLISTLEKQNTLNRTEAAPRALLLQVFLWLANMYIRAIYAAVLAASRLSDQQSAPVVAFSEMPALRLLDLRQRFFGTMCISRSARGFRHAGSPCLMIHGVPRALDTTFIA
jgi:hypothetical protein